MKLTISTLLIFWFILGSGINAQDCPMYFPDEVGTVREVTFYDQRDRLSSITRQETLDKIVNGNEVTIKVGVTNYTKDDELIYSSELEFACKDGVFQFDLKDYLDPNTLASYEEMGIDFTADNLVYPANLSVGDVLPDGELIMSVKSGTMTIFTLTLTISNRKVEEIEEITTDAGTFSCYKLSYDTTTKAGIISSSSSVIEWISEGVGMVRNETYNRRGRLTGYSVLTGFDN